MRGGHPQTQSLAEAVMLAAAIIVIGQERLWHSLRRYMSGRLGTASSRIGYTAFPTVLPLHVLCTGQGGVHSGAFRTIGG